MSDGFKGFAKPGKDKEFTLNINGKQVQKIIREYKKLKKYQKSSMFVPNIGCDLKQSAKR